MFVTKHPSAYGPEGVQPVFIDYFEDGNLNKWVQAGSPVIVDNPDGGEHHCVQVEGPGDSVSKTLDTPLTTATLKLKIRYHHITAGTTMQVTMFDSSARYVMDSQLVCASNLYRYYNGSTWITLVDSLSADVWYTMKFFNFNFTNHTCNIGWNGIDKGACAFRNSAANNFNKFSLGADNNGAEGFFDKVKLSGW